jgi:ribonuclease HI
VTDAVIYTDGACIGNPGPGGWAAIIQRGARRTELTGRSHHTTNNRMEMRAAIHALESLSTPTRVILYTDSQYLRDGITKWVHGWQRNGWRTSTKQPVKNADLWQRLLRAATFHAPAGGVEWRWVRGHAGNPGNTRADTLATAEARRATAADPEDLDSAVGRLL